MISFKELCQRRQDWGERKYAVKHPDTGEMVNAGRAGLRDEWKDVMEELADAVNILGHIKTRSLGYFTKLDDEAIDRIIEHTIYIAGLLQKVHDDPSILPIVWGQDRPSVRRIGWDEPIDIAWHGSFADMPSHGIWEDRTDEELRELGYEF